MRLTLAQRREILASMPWVAVSPPAGLFDKRCEGLLASRPMYARQHMTRVEQQNRYGCHKRARWVFISLDGEISTVCWWHLFERFYATDEEIDRYQRWVDNYVTTHPDLPYWDPDEPDEPLSQR